MATTITTDAINNAGVPPAPPEAHQRADVENNFHVHPMGQKMNLIIYDLPEEHWAEIVPTKKVRKSS